MPELVDRILDNLAAVRERVAAAALRSGRPAEAVRIIAVTKYVGAAECRALVEAGCVDLGESRPQQLWARAEALRDLPVSWHLVGHLQRNKIRRTLPAIAWLHSLDSVRLLEALDVEAALLGRRLAALVEVNIAGEPGRHGFAPAELEPLMPTLSRYEHVAVRGLMAMAPLEGGAAAARRAFARLRELRDGLRAVCPPGVALDELSMGMSGDYEIAIEEGATMVRIGSALLAGLETGG